VTRANARDKRFAIPLTLGKLCIVERLILLLIVCGLLGGCVDTGPVFSRDGDKHDPVAGEATPPPETGPRGGWAW
jgi:hypothetical protein